MFPNACRDENKVIWEEILTSLDWIECVCVGGGCRLWRQETLGSARKRVMEHAKGFNKEKWAAYVTGPKTFLLQLLRHI